MKSNKRSTPLTMFYDRMYITGFKHGTMYADVGRKLDIIMREMLGVKFYVEELKDEIKKLRRDLNDRNTGATTTAAGADSPNLLLQGIFPITTLNSLQDVDDKLQSDEEFREALNLTLKKLKGKDYRQSVGNVLRFLFTNELAADLAWSGTAEKAALKSFCNVSALIFDICKQPTATQKDVLDIIKNWLRNSKKRRPTDLGIPPL
ncbi:hypothetical protein WDU94_005911 [Cyamophila willieti]